MVSTNSDMPSEQMVHKALIEMSVPKLQKFYEEGKELLEARDFLKLTKETVDVTHFELFAMAYAFKEVMEANVEMVKTIADLQSGGE